MNQEIRRSKEIYLAWIYGKLNFKEENLDDIEKLTDDELCEKITDYGMLVDWE